jgi:FlaG/FlaF family flagellin (archaellin)
MITKQRETAVSPVVGVMLMLVVTIIIAAVVSAFAGGMAGTERKTPVAQISAQANIADGIKGEWSSSTFMEYPPGYTCDNNYILFSHNGGDSFNLNDIYIVIDHEGNKYTINPSDKPVRPDDIYDMQCRSFTVADWERTSYPTINYIDAIGIKDGFIRPGDVFKLTFDGNYRATTGQEIGYLILYKHGAAGQLSGSTLTGRMTVPANKNVRWMIVDRYSGKIISSGDVVLA